MIMIYNVTYFAECPGPEMPASDQPDCCPPSLHHHLPLFFSVIKYHAYTHAVEEKSNNTDGLIMAVGEDAKMQPECSICTCTVPQCI